MAIVLRSIWQATKDVSFMFFPGIIMSFLVFLHSGDVSKIFGHVGWALLSVMLFVLFLTETSATLHRDIEKDKGNRKIGTFAGFAGLLASCSVLNLAVMLNLDLTKIEPFYYKPLLWTILFAGVALRFTSRNILLQRSSGRYK